MLQLDVLEHADLDLDLQARPWIAAVATDAVHDLQQQRSRKRPLIYVYDLPSIYNTRILQYRVAKV